jgi:hypothetical protein
MAKPTPFYATRNDLLNWLSAVSTEINLALTEYGLFNESMAKTMPLVELPILGISETGNHLTDKTYLVHGAMTKITSREVTQRRGGVLYSVDQKLNPDTVGIKAGGNFGKSVVISGQLGLGTGSPRSDELASLLLKELKRQFRKIKSYYVGKEAASILNAGGRLTINVDASKDYDLAPERVPNSEMA